MTDQFADYLVKLNDNTKIKKGLTKSWASLNKIPSQYRSYVNAAFEGYFNKISKAKGGN